MSDDLKLCHHVIAELSSVPGVDLACIDVNVLDGAVTLSGHVANAAVRHDVEQAARRVRGIRAVTPLLEVLPVAKQELADDEIAARVGHILDWDLHLSQGGVEVCVEQAVVTLSGMVKWHNQRHAAESAVRRLAGVQKVINKIKVCPEVGVSDLQWRIQAAIERTAGLESAKIAVDVGDDGEVALRGHASTLAQQLAAENAAWAVPGVSLVANHIAVIPYNAAEGSAARPSLA